MSGWEFRYVELWLGEEPAPREVGDWENFTGIDFDEELAARKAEIAQLGAEGWEPVGEVRIFSTWPRESYARSVRQLMFKRPLP